MGDTVNLGRFAYASIGLPVVVTFLGASGRLGAPDHSTYKTPRLAAASRSRLRGRSSGFVLIYSSFRRNLI